MQQPSINDNEYDLLKKLVSNIAELTGGGGGGAVSSVFGRTGAVVAASADYQAFYARLTASNNFTGSNNQFASKVSIGGVTAAGHAYLYGFDGDSGILTISDPTGNFLLDVRATNITDFRQIEWPDASGTLALLSDIPSGGVSSISGTANQIVASASTGAVTLSLDAAIAGVNSITAATATSFQAHGGDSGATLLLGAGAGGALISSNSGGGSSVLNIYNASTSGFSSITFADSSVTPKMVIGYGNSATGAPLTNQGYLYTTSGVDFLFYVNANDVGRITSTGNFLWGTSSDPGGTKNMALGGTLSIAPTARTSGVASYVTITPPSDTGITATTESIGINFPTGTRTWAGTGTVPLQREIVFAGKTYGSASASQTFTDVFGVFMTPPLAGTNVIFSRRHTLGILDSTSAASSITGGFIVATTLGTTATSVGIGGGNINAGGSITAGSTIVASTTLSGLTSVFSAKYYLGGSTTDGSATSKTSIIKMISSIADNTATNVLTITVPNAAHSANIRVRLVGSLGAGGAIGANEATGFATYDIAIARTAGVNAVAGISAVYGACSASVAGGATIAVTAAMSAVGGGVSASNTFFVQITIAHGSGSSTNHTCRAVAEVINANATGVTIA